MVCGALRIQHWLTLNQMSKVAVFISLTQPSHCPLSGSLSTKDHEYVMQCGVRLVWASEAPTGVYERTLICCNSTILRLDNNSKRETEEKGVSTFQIASTLSLSLKIIRIMFIFKMARC